MDVEAFFVAEQFIFSPQSLAFFFVTITNHHIFCLLWLRYVEV